MTICWRRAPAATGLARVTQGFRSWSYGDGDYNFISVHASDRYGQGDLKVSFHVNLEIWNLKYPNNKRTNHNISLTQKFTDIEEAKVVGRKWYEDHKELFSFDGSE